MTPAAPLEPENIPDELAERDQWLMWDNSADTPRRPHWRGNFSISWSNPDDWHSFEEAVEAASERESWGIGYVCAMDNDDHATGLYGCLDIDGGVYYSEEKGRVTPEDWLPSLQKFIDDGAYIETSPSGDGLHIPLVGQEAPEWWSDSHFSADEHRGVEYLTNKFVTFTGDTLKPDFDSVADTDPTDFLFRAHTAIHGQNPRPGSDGDGPSAKDRDWSEDDIENALGAIDSSCPYSKWRNIGFAVHNWDDGPTGKRLFEQWSRGSGWDDDSQQHIENIWSGADSNGDITLGTLIHHAKEGGWSPSPPEQNNAPKEAFPDDHDRRDTDESDQTEASDDADRTNDDRPDWARARVEFSDDEGETGRYIAAENLEKETDWMYVIESGKLWVYDRQTGYYDPRGRSYARQLLESELGAHYSKHDRDEIVEKIEARNQTRRKELNARTRDTPLVCVGNGVVDLESGDLTDHSPEFKFTRGLAWDYDPANADPDAILDFLDDITEREADRDTLLDHLAHGLMPGHPYRAFVMTYGPGSNGKTQMGQLFRGFVGEENAASVELQDLTGDDSFATGGLPGAFINVGDDISVGQISDISILKSLTGAGTVRANQKYEKQYEFQNEAAMFFSANEPPRIAEKTPAVADRLYPIEMPYRFVDDPDGPLEKPKTPGIASDLLDDDAAMRGLLLLAVKHAQELVERNGQYSQPETASERMERYDAAADPIKRFAMKHMESTGSGNDAVLKDDAYSVYTAFCDATDERAASADGFKRKVSQLGTVDFESKRTRDVTPGESRDRVWAYAGFAESAREFMPERLQTRYFDQEESDIDDDDNDGDDTDSTEIDAPYGAVAIHEAARSPTNYVTVTAQVVAVDALGENGETTKAVLVDQSGAIDCVVYDRFGDIADELHGLEGQTIALRNAEVGEWDGSVQLQASAATQIVEIQAGVGYTEGAAASDGQHSLDDSANADAATDDGETETSPEQSKDEPDQPEPDTADDPGDEYDQPKPIVTKAVREAVENNGNAPASLEDVAAACDLARDAVEDTLADLKQIGRIQQMNGKYIPT